MRKVFKLGHTLGQIAGLVSGSTISAWMAHVSLAVCLLMLLVSGNQAQAQCQLFSPSAAPSYDVGTIPLSVAVGDFNGDGRPDLALANFEPDYLLGSVSVLLGNGDGNFQPRQDFATGGFSWSSGSHARFRHLKAV